MTAEDTLKPYLQSCQKRVEQALEKWLPARNIQPTTLHEAMRYSTLNGGKRVRPVLVYAAGQALNVPPETLDGPACAVELMHAYSLVHDDLPAMDNDDLRRGKPTCHKAYGEATAILTGDALQTLAFKVLCLASTLDCTAETRLEMIETLVLASGSRGMAGGQAMDLDAVGRQIDLTQLENMHIHKTGALIRASVKLAMLAAPTADKNQIRNLDHYAKCIGLAFQVQDDILDIEGNTEALGKTQGKDQAQDKSTYPSLMGLEAAREMAQHLHHEALRSLDSLDVQADPLRWLADYIVRRSH
ncbi:(2E,6E)-farnesyl diphosphate synthase [Candidatus Vondammii sp. HM_W22]|uniref:(2E,6E)-farnesyl diphosphate synthase n=1 Tax=Candidatus Vondammii sp. HM_W22 TaxID=2687299 RepID=UPI001F12F30B|nr:farnesyl diphosphate synthase [Candidatus Vondammii sp. HM_W22]